MALPPLQPTARGNGIAAPTETAMTTSTFTQLPRVSVTTASELSIPFNWDHKTSIYLDKAPGYWQLPACAMTPISTIVRDMSKGCGDGGRLTSYTCFCTDSYFKARWDISTDIASSCGRNNNNNNNYPATISIAASATPTTTVSASDSVLPFPRAAVQSALNVFEAYCDVGVAQGIYAPSDKSSFGESIFICIGGYSCQFESALG
ncbi:GPI ethanolamine phosphate transferase 2 [Apiospora arundinis]